jgi:signal transduction histidine kinase
LQASVKRSSDVLTKLLDYARLQTLDTAAFTAKVDVHQIAKQVIAEQAFRAIAEAQDIELAAEGLLLVLGEVDHLKVIIENLVDNAIRYSGKGAQIVLSIKLEPDHFISIRVLDTGPGFSQSDALIAFDRFKRGSLANAPHDKQTQLHQGSGLGLAIVLMAAQKLGGTASTERISKADRFGVLVRLPGQ